MLSLGDNSPQKQVKKIDANYQILWCARLVATMLFFAMIPSAFAETSATTSPAFGKGDCSIAYLQSARKKPASKVMKKEALAAYKQKVPNGPDGEICSKSLKDYLRTDADDCMVYCNPS